MNNKAFKHHINGLLTLIFTTILTGCMPDIKNITKDNQLFDYQISAFPDEQTDSLLTDHWYKYELYLKPTTDNSYYLDNKLKLTVSSDKDRKFYFQIFDVKGKALSDEKYFGNAALVNQSDISEDKLMVKIKMAQTGSSQVALINMLLEWNTVNKAVSKSIVLVGN